jgi:hypothetical protein
VSYLELAKQLIRQHRGGESATSPVRAQLLAPANRKEVTSESPSPKAVRELVRPLDALINRAEKAQMGIEPPTRRCRACNSWLYWVSVYGAVVCAGCHPPASRDLVRAWYWLPEGEGKRIQ